MFKQIFELFKADSLYEQALVECYEMLEIDREMFNESVKSLRASDTADIPIDIYAMDKKINEFERDVRRKVMTHLVVSGNEDLGSGLILVSVVVDIERIGDYTKNIYDLAVQHPKKLTAGKNFSIGVCPETANPGEIMKDFTNLPRLVGAIDEKTAKMIMEIYKHVFPVELIKMINCKTANAVKLTTNVFRDLNIAFVNQLALLFEKLGIDTFQVLDAAKRKYNFQVHYPGPGVGGPCLPVNSYQLLNSANQFDDNILSLVKLGRNINESMPDHVIELIIDGLKETNKQISNATILVLGVSYKPEVKDIQLSPAEQVVDKLKEHGAKIKIYDPFFKATTVFGIQTEKNIDQAFANVDSVVFLTAHNEFYDLKSSVIASKIPIPVVIDTKRILDPDDAKKSGLILRTLGSGNF